MPLQQVSLLSFFAGFVASMTFIATLARRCVTNTGEGFGRALLTPVISHQELHGMAWHGVTFTLVLVRFVGTIIAPTGLFTDACSPTLFLEGP
jgi:hypothetical protein